MTELLDKVTAYPLTTALLLCIFLYILHLINTGKIKRIDKNGIEASIDNETTEEDQNKRIARLEANMSETLTIVKEQSQTIKDIELAVIRLQILSDQTNLETKLKLFDIYKSKGGNSYIDLYIKQIEQAATSAKED